jgi:hypothetical protein
MWRLLQVRVDEQNDQLENEVEHNLYHLLHWDVRQDRVGRPVSD